MLCNWLCASPVPCLHADSHFRKAPGKVDLLLQKVCAEYRSSFKGGKVVLESCETEGERDAPLAGEPSLPHNKNKEEGPQPAPGPAAEAQQGTETGELTENLQGVTMREVQEEKA